MRRVSPKRQRRNAACRDLRDEYRAEFPRCQWCGERATDLHEIARGASRNAALSERCCWLHLCRACHEIVGGLPVVAQLAIKWLADPIGYDRRKVNEIRGRAPEAISEGDVDEWVRRLTRLAT
jgi:hypothetical protein